MSNNDINNKNKNISAFENIYNHFNPPKTLGDYIIKKTIGKGTFSKVKLGIHKETKQKVAIKILEKSALVEKDDIERLIREMEMLNSLDNINIVKVFEINEDEDNYFIIMEYCEGGELFNYIVKNQRLSEKETAYFFYQIINGVEYIHSKGIVHRDLKPENLLLSENKIIKIIDFGLSNYFDGKNLLHTPCGSPCYASPEMVGGNNYNGFYIDTWAIGIILFAMMCGYLPFEDENNDILFKKILRCKLNYPQHLSEVAKDIMKKILVTDPEERIKLDEIKRHKFYLWGKKLFMEKFKKKDEKEENGFRKANTAEAMIIKYFNNNYDNNKNINNKIEKIEINADNKENYNNNNINNNDELLINKPTNTTTTTTSNKNNKNFENYFDKNILSKKNNKKEFILQKINNNNEKIISVNRKGYSSNNRNNHHYDNKIIITDSNILNNKNNKFNRNINNNNKNLNNINNHLNKNKNISSGISNLLTDYESYNISNYNQNNFNKNNNNKIKIKFNSNKISNNGSNILNKDQIFDNNYKLPLNINKEKRKHSNAKPLFKHQINLNNINKQNIYIDNAVFNFNMFNPENLNSRNNKNVKLFKQKYNSNEKPILMNLITNDNNNNTDRKKLPIITGRNYIQTENNYVTERNDKKLNNHNFNNNKIKQNLKMNFNNILKFNNNNNIFLINEKRTHK